MFELPRSRSSSCSLPTKCLTDVPTPCDCTPRTKPVPMRPARNGSSEYASKLRPASGVRWMLTFGPSSTWTPSAFASRPIGFAHLLHDVRVPGRRHGDAGRKHGRGLVVVRAHAVRPVGEPQRRHAGRWQRRRAERGAAAHQEDALALGELREQGLDARRIGSERRQHGQRQRRPPRRALIGIGGRRGRRARASSFGQRGSARQSGERPGDPAPPGRRPGSPFLRTCSHNRVHGAEDRMAQRFPQLAARLQRCSRSPIV